MCVLKDNAVLPSPPSLGRDSHALISALAEGLEHAHNARVVHCDVKPDPWLADFGISRAIHAEVRALGKRAGLDTSAGTPAYVSPEQASGEAHIDGRADVYSLPSGLPVQ